jgi:hypothetical protein
VSRLRLVVSLALLVGLLGTGLVLGTAAESVPRQFGSSPYQEVLEAAAAAPRSSSCSISDNGLAALMLSVTWPETGAGTGPPSPMTLSRYDTASGLYFEGNASTSHRRAFWHPGVGMWQFDSAGLGSARYAAHYISAAGSAPAAASAMASRYCSATAGGATGSLARAAAWAPWNACGDGDCEEVFNDIYSGGSLQAVSGSASVTTRGGMVSRICGRGGSTQVFSPCFYVDPDLAEGQDWWTNPNVGAAPITAPFYVFETGGYEYRVWLKEDTGYSFDIEAARPLGQNARSSLHWNRATALCAKVSSSQRFCDVSPTHPFYAEVQWVSTEGIAQGDTSGDYRPAAAVSRQAMAAFLYRLAGSPAYTPPSTPTFPDIGTSHQFRKEIEWLVSRDVIEGYDDGLYRPLSPVSRQATAAFLFRLAGSPANPQPPAQGATFPDVSRQHTFWREIEWLVDVSVASGYDDGYFRPSTAVSRMAMAAFLRRYDTNVA